MRQYWMVPLTLFLATLAAPSFAASDSYLVRYTAVTGRQMMRGRGRRFAPGIYPAGRRDFTIVLEENDESPLDSILRDFDLAGGEHGALQESFGMSDVASFRWRSSERGGHFEIRLTNGFVVELYPLDSILRLFADPSFEEQYTVPVMAAKYSVEEYLDRFHPDVRSMTRAWRAGERYSEAIPLGSP